MQPETITKPTDLGKTEVAKPVHPAHAHLAFATGLEGLVIGKTVNTFRKGLKWSQKAKVGDTIHLTNVGDTIIGDATVTDIIIGKWAGLTSLAVDNHAVTGLAPLEAASVLSDVLAGVYDDLNLETDDLTVVYFTRTK